MSGLIWKIAMCNVQNINVLAKQENVICWHKNMGNLISIFTETKLKDKIYLWIAGKFEDVCMFTSGLNSGYLSAGVVIVMNFSLAKHVYKVSEMPGRLLSIRLLFKNKLSVSVLGLYAGALSVAWFSQTGKINFFITKAANKFSFIILGGDFNKNSLKRSAGFKKQANKDHWKFDFKDADDAKWSEFKEAMAANAAMFSDSFITSA
ncbi:hypothetical protein G9A89_013414 [Geosiphon pyriformis]|nr:hypothetical protein G9A89_013414 [Geosiphon pyriformis]